MNDRYVVTALAVALCAAVLSPAYGYSAEVRERMMVRNLAPVQLDDSLKPVVARDAAAGAGIFEYSEGPMGFGWPMIAAGRSGLPYNVAMLDSSGSLLSRTRIPLWGSWDPVFDVAGPGTQPMFETHNIASSKDSEKVCITWVRTDTSPMPGYYRLSTDAGATWGPIQELDRPPAYGGDTATSFHVSSLYPFYDDRSRLHVVAAVHPIVHDTAFIMPAEIWHWCQDNSPAWSRVHRAGCAPEHLLAPVGYNALYADRPNGFARAGDHLFLTWEQFDSANVDPQTNLLRANIYVCSGDGHGNWGDSCLVSERPNSCRFPYAVELPTSESTLVTYEMDQVAGFCVLGQGPATNNPIVARTVTFPVSGMRLGWADTIGGTTYDLQCCGAVHRTACLAPGYGVHASWMGSTDTSGLYPDLNMRYNFYDFVTRNWNWTDPDYMQSGVNVFMRKTALGSLDVNPTTGAAVISGCTYPPLPHVAVEEPTRPGARPATPWSWFLAISPNPVMGRADIRYDVVRRTEVRLGLYDASGRLVKDLASGEAKPGRYETEIRTAALAPGVYFVCLDTPGFRDVKKAVVAR
jgi:hypothetical protein